MSISERIFLPEATPEDVKSGWRLEARFLRDVQRYIAQNKDEWVELEDVESVLVAFQDWNNGVRLDT